MGSGLTYGSVCSGIEAATTAWHPLGWRPQFFSEIDPAPRAVLQYRHPEIPLHGDFTTIQASTYRPIQLLVGGTPCQSFSIAGLRGGLADDRGNLALEFLRLAHRLRPRWLVWENVPGVLSSDGGRDFGAILGGMVELGYRFAYRVLDAQYVRVDRFGGAVPQRRRRVFVVGHLGDWRRPAAVLFERASLRGDPAPRREAGSAVAALTANGVGTCGADDNQGQAGHLVAHSLRGEGFDASEDGTGRGTPIVPVAFGGNDTRGPIQVATAVNAHGGPCGRMYSESETFIAFDTTQITSGANRSNPQPGDPCHLLASGAHPPAIAFDCKAGANTGFAIGEVPGALRGEGHGGGHAAIAIGHNGGPSIWRVRRLTPLECERLQGFPDGHTAVPWRGGIMPDGPRYKMLGNSMACNVMAWIGWRIEMVEALGLDAFTTEGVHA